MKMITAHEELNSVCLFLSSTEWCSWRVRRLGVLVTCSALWLSSVSSTRTWSTEDGPCPACSTGYWRPSARAPPIDGPGAGDTTYPSGASVKTPHPIPFEPLIHVYRLIDPSDSSTATAMTVHQHVNLCFSQDSKVYKTLARSNGSQSQDP